MKLPKPTIEHLWIFLTLGSCFGYACTQPLNQIDFWHYLKAGETTIKTFHILDKDIFTFTIQNQPYINVHWGAQVLYYLIYKLGNIKLVEFAHALLLTISFSLIFILVKNQIKDSKISAVVIFFAFIISSTNFTLRPQEFSILFFTIVLFLLKTQRLFFIPPLMLLWTNIHGAFLLGLILIVIEWLGSFKPKVLIILLISLLATLCNPWGYRIYEAIFGVENISRTTCHIQEWSSPSFHEFTGFSFFAAFLILVTLQTFRKTKLNKSDLIALITFSILAFSSLRSVIWWVLISAPMFANTLNEIIPKKNKNKTEDNFIINWAIVLLFSIYLISCTPWFKVQNKLLPPKKQLLIEASTPILIAKELHKNPNICRIYNEYSWGSYLIWALRADQKIFYYPFAHIFPRKVINDYFAISNANYNWQDILDKYKVDTLVLNKEEQDHLIPFVQASDKWKKIYEDKLGFIFVRP